MRHDYSTHGIMYYIGEIVGAIVGLITGMNIMVWLLKLF